MKSLEARQFLKYGVFEAIMVGILLWSLPRSFEAPIHIIASDVGYGFVFIFAFVTLVAVILALAEEIGVRSSSRGESLQSASRPNI